MIDEIVLYYLHFCLDVLLIQCINTEYQSYICVPLCSKQCDAIIVSYVKIKPAALPGLICDSWWVGCEQRVRHWVEPFPEAGLSPPCGPCVPVCACLAGFSWRESVSNSASPFPVERLSRDALYWVGKCNFTSIYPTWTFLISKRKKFTDRWEPDWPKYYLSTLEMRVIEKHPKLRGSFLGYKYPKPQVPKSLTVNPVLASQRPSHLGRHSTFLQYCQKKKRLILKFKEMSVF